LLPDLNDVELTVDARVDILYTGDGIRCVVVPNAHKKQTTT